MQKINHFEEVLRKLYKYMSNNSYDTDLYEFDRGNNFKCRYFSLQVNDTEKVIDLSFSFLNKQKDTAMFALIIHQLFVTEKFYSDFKIRISEDFCFVKNEIHMMAPAVHILN